MARLASSPHVRERDLADLIKDLEVALYYSRGFYVRPPDRSGNRVSVGASV